MRGRFFQIVGYYLPVILLLLRCLLLSFLCNYIYVYLYVKQAVFREGEWTERSRQAEVDFVRGSQGGIPVHAMRHGACWDVRYQG